MIKKFALLLFVVLAFMIYFNDGTELKVRDISIGQWSRFAKITPMDFREKPYYIKVDDIKRIQEVD